MHRIATAAVFVRPHYQREPKIVRPMAGMGRKLPLDVLSNFSLDCHGWGCTMA
jgi:hypothetical protein